MCCTSPPYAYKRRYEGVSPSLWPAVSYSPMPGLPPVGIPAVTAEVIAETSEAGLLGLEPDPFAYIGHLVLIFREAWRVLRDDGILCVNIGDSYNTSRGSIHRTPGNLSGGLEKMRGGDATSSASRGIETGKARGYKPKDLMGIPWRLAFALCADGWTLRSRMPGGVEMRPDVIWTKNAMPESVRDRPSVDFEDVFIFSKRKRYCWDQENGRTTYGDWRNGDPGPGKGAGDHMVAGSRRYDHATAPQASGANMRASWRINTEPTSEEHYAAWPMELVRRLISIGTSDKGCCPECGAQWARSTTRDQAESTRGAQAWGAGSGTMQRDNPGGGVANLGGPIAVSSWSPSCSCPPADPVPCSVLDPFSGIGRSGEVCYELGRRYMPAEISIGYAAIQHRRLADHRAVARGEGLPAATAKTITGPLFPA